jgi:ribonuclease T
MARRFRGYLPVAIDVETGGFHAATDALLEIAATLIDMDAAGNLSRGATHNFHVKPFEGSRIDPLSLGVTGIDPDHPLRPALPERDALQRVFREIRHVVRAYGCRRAILVGHNAAFDLGFLNAAVARAEVKRNPFHPFSCFDTATLAGAALGQTVPPRRYASPASNGTPECAQRAHAERSADLFCLVCNRCATAIRRPPSARALGWLTEAAEPDEGRRKQRRLRALTAQGDRHATGPRHMITTVTLPASAWCAIRGGRGLTVRSRSFVGNIFGSRYGRQHEHLRAAVRAGARTPEGYLVAAPASASSFFSSPLLYISSAMSQPPTSSPLTYSCG